MNNIITNKCSANNLGVSVSHITKSYGDTSVFSDFSMNIAAGETTVFMAPSGFGKTTLLRMITGLEKPGSGEIVFSSTPSYSVVFQENRLMENTSILKNILAVMPSTGLSLATHRSQKEKVLEALRTVELDNPYQHISELSGGMKRRVAIVRALMADYNIIIMDEPFKGLDDKLKSKVMEYVRECTKERTFFLITHNEEEKRFFTT